MTPDSVRGIRTEHLVQSIDIAPTMLDLAGVDLPKTFQGTSFRGLIEGSDQPVHEYIFTENLWSTHFGNPRIEASLEGEPPVYEELYDIESDPAELQNQIDNPDYAATLRRLKFAWKEKLTEARGTGAPKVLRYTVDSDMKRPVIPFTNKPKRRVKK